MNVHCKAICGREMKEDKYNFVKGHHPTDGA
jgi:hypothetical protein